MQNILKITYVILGAIIGAGFISGQEIYLFFYKYGTSGLVGIIISGIIIGIIINKTCIILKNNNINNYQEFIKIIIPSKNKYIKLILNNIITIFLLISFFIMCAALNSFFKQEFNIPLYLIGFINFILCIIIFLKENKIIIKINEFLIPIIILLIIFLMFKNSVNISFYEISINNNLILSIFNGILYASYNSILLIPVLITLNKLILNKNQINIISIISSFFIIFLEIIIYFLISNINNFSNIEFPLIYIANLYGLNYYYTYSFVIAIAIFTTIISVGYSFLINTCKNKKKYKLLALLICFLSIFISYLGFSNLVNILYPIFGVLGIIQIFFLIKY